MDATITRETIADRPARNGNSQTTTVGADGVGGFDQGRHLLSHANGGAGERINIVPMEGALNQGHRDAWRDMENQINAHARAGTRVEMNMRLSYGDVATNPNRPSSIVVDVFVDGRLIDEFGFDNLLP